MTAFDAGALILAFSASVTDLRASRVPNALTAMGALAGIAAHTVFPGGSGPAASALGSAAGLVVFLPFFVLGGMGGGDVKLMAALGAWLGAPAILVTALYTAVVGGVLALAVALARGYLREAFSNIAALLRHWMLVGVRSEPSLTLERGRGPRLPYAVPILIGLIVTVWRR